MALDWIPIFPDQVPRRRRVSSSDLTPIFTAAVIPAVQAPGFLAFLPTFPDQVPHRRSQAARTETVAPPPAVIAAILTQSWRPTFPDQVPHRRTAAAAHPAYQAPPPGPLIVIGQQLAWQATFPDRVPHRRSLLNSGGWSVLPIQPSVAAAVPGICVDLANDLVTSTTFVTEALTTPALLSEAEGSSTFQSEGIC